MKSVGEAMAIGRTFKEALQKGIRSMEVKRFGFGLDKYDKWLNAQRLPTWHGEAAMDLKDRRSHRKHASHGRGAAKPVTTHDKTTQGESLDHEWPIPDEKLRRKLAVPSQGRLYYIRYAMKMGWTIEQIHELTNIDPWFLGQMKQLVDFEDELVELAKAATSCGSSACKDATEVRGSMTDLHRAKEWGYSDLQLAHGLGITADNRSQG